MIGFLILLLAAYVTVALVVFRRHKGFLKFLAFLLITQNIATMAVLKLGIVPIESGQTLLLVKEVVFAVAFGLMTLTALSPGTLAHIRVDRTQLLIIAYFVFLLFPLVTTTSPSLLAALGGYRSLAILPGMYLLGRWLAVDRRGLWAFYRLIVTVALVLAAFGLVEAYLLPESFWLSIGHEEYYLMKRGREIQGSLYENMRFWVGETPVRRVASLTGDPLVSSYVMAFPIALIFGYVYLYRRVRFLHLFVLGSLSLSTLLTMSRGAFVTLGLAGLLLIFSLRRARLFAGLLVGGFLGAIAVALTLGSFILNFTTGVGHLEQLRKGILIGLNAPLGLGLGTASGLVGGLLNSLGFEGVAADSFVGSVAVQTGIVGLILFVIVMAAPCIDLFAKGLALYRLGDRSAWLTVGTAAFLAGLLVVSTVNEAGYGFVATGLAFTMAGLLTGNAVRVLRSAEEPTGRLSTPSGLPACG